MKINNDSTAMARHKANTKPITLGIFTFLATIALSRINWPMDSSIQPIDFRHPAIATAPLANADPSPTTQAAQYEQFTPVDLSPRRTELYDPKSYAYDPGHLDGPTFDGTYMLLQHRNDPGPRNNCNFILQNSHRIERIHFHVYSCRSFDDMFGNRLGQIYGIRLIANALRVPFYFTCGLFERSDTNGGGGASHLMELNTDTVGPVPSRGDVEYTAEEICRLCDRKFCTWNFIDLDLAADLMYGDWRYLTQSKYVTFADREDDAVIHLRLGDGLYSTFGTNEGKGLFPHGTYISLLRRAVLEKGSLQSIGIVTSPFEGDNIRTFDHGYESLTKLIAYDLVSALQAAFPKTRIRIHNSSSGTIFESQCRIVLARKVAICGCSTFCANAVVATRGIGYIYNTATNQNIWARNAARRYENIRLFDAPLLNGMVISNEKTGERLEDAEVLEWLRVQSPDVGGVDITKKPIFVQN